MSPFVPFFLLLTVASTLRANEIPAIMGDWVGGFVNPPERNEWAENPSLVAEVVGMGPDRFNVRLMNVFERRCIPYFEAEFSAPGGRIEGSNGPWEFVIEADRFHGTVGAKHQGKAIRIPFELAKVKRVSPTMGLAPPDGADVLIGPDGSLGAWEHSGGKPPTWKVIEGGVVEILPRRSGNPEGGDLVSKNQYKDCRIHLEFKLPYSPEKRGQERNNSGLFISGPYEVQILDSYGFHSGWTECGSLYRVSPAKVNRCRPPEQWQTYDVEFRAAVFSEDGNLIRPPVITVYHNGELIHHQQEIFEVPQWREVNRKVPHRKEPGPITLQDHNDPVQFRNMWVESS